MALQLIPSEFTYIQEKYEENLIFFFISVSTYCTAREVLAFHAQLKCDVQLSTFA